MMGRLTGNQNYVCGGENWLNKTLLCRGFLKEAGCFREPGWSPCQIKPAPSEFGLYF